METLEDNILASVKDEVGLDPDYEDAYDNQLLKLTNSVFFELMQRGIGPKDGFECDGTQCWLDFDTKRMITKHVVRDYVCAKVHMKFDPPSSSTLNNALQETINECGFRLDVEEDDS